MPMSSFLRFFLFSSETETDNENDGIYHGDDNSGNDHGKRAAAAALPLAPERLYHALEFKASSCSTSIFSIFYPFH